MKFQVGDWVAYWGHIARIYFIEPETNTVSLDVRTSWDGVPGTYGVWQKYVCVTHDELVRHQRPWHYRPGYKRWKFTERVKAA